MASIGVMVSIASDSSFRRRASFSMLVMEIWSSAATRTVRTGAPLVRLKGVFTRHGTSPQ